MSVLKGTGDAAAATPSAWICAGFSPDFYLAVVLTAEATVRMRMTEKPSSVLQTGKLASLRGLLQLVSMFVEGLTSQVGLVEGVRGRGRKRWQTYRVALWTVISRGSFWTCGSSSSRWASLAFLSSFTFRSLG